MRIYRYGRVMHLTDNLYFYRGHADSLTETKKMLLSVDGGYKRFLNRRRLKDSVKEKIRSTALFNVLLKSKGISC